MPLQIFPQQRKNWPKPTIVAAAVATGEPRWPYRTAPMETVDRVMDMQCALFELAQVTNEYYRIQILILMLTAFMMIVFDCYGLLDLLYSPYKSARKREQSTA